MRVFLQESTLALQSFLCVQEEERAARQKDKLRALELGGLIDFTDEHARLVQALACS